ncbi:hypothetical protein PA25_25420 [Pseudoalteromonas sp. A25]|uniref:DUF4386 family protein n=1 Tax=Pseudoalteromonas sp. A25 TaxID=116092 RepID=UPI0012A1A69D|nr:DUF4386 family protein [Pseudoalteromonas sp. A25]BBN82557.1 hypothetical protein PA25_25420 [Pseudoalteromonas sp. A25]
MQDTKKIAKWVGALFLIQLLGGIWLNFFALKPLSAPVSALSADMLHAMGGIAVLLMLVMSSFNLIIGLISRVLSPKNGGGLFLAVVALSAISLTLTAIESIKLAEFVSWLAYLVENSITEPSSVESLFRQTIAQSRNSAHFMAIMFSSISLTCYYFYLLRAKVLPKPLLIFALFACALQMIAVGHSFFDAPIPVVMQLPLAVTQLALPLYLLFKGFTVEPSTKYSQQQ